MAFGWSIITQTGPDVISRSSRNQTYAHIYQEFILEKHRVESHCYRGQILFSLHHFGPYAFFMLADTIVRRSWILPTVLTVMRIIGLLVYALRPRQMNNSAVEFRQSHEYSFENAMIRYENDETSGRMNSIPHLAAHLTCLNSLRKLSLSQAYRIGL